MATKKKPTYIVEAVVTSWVSIEVYADTMAEALDTAKTLQREDFVSTEGEFIDGDMKIVAVRNDAVQGKVYL